jgi:CBS domain-containing protein
MAGGDAMIVRDAMTRRAETIGPDETLQAAARRMREVGVGALAVCVRGRPVGILTDRDLVVRSVAEGRDPAADTVRSAMTPQVIACSEDADLGTAAAQMGERAVRRLLVLDAAEQLVGMLSADDVALHSPALAGEVIGRTRDPERPQQPELWPWRE